MRPECNQKKCNFLDFLIRGVQFTTHNATYGKTEICIIARLKGDQKMGVTINKRKTTGDWYVWISYKGQRTSRKIGKDRRTAMKAATEYRKKLALGQVDFSNGRNEAQKNLTFGQFCADYLENVAKHRLKYNSWTSYEKTAKLYLLPTWKDKRLDSITRHDVKMLLLEKQASGLVVNNIRICISAIFTEAVERELIAVNPAHNLGKVLRNGGPKTQPRFLSKEQACTLLETAQKEAAEFYDFLLTAFRTGMRLGELLALSWDCINFDTKQIIVRRSFSHSHWDTPKSHKVRYVDMSDGLYEALRNCYNKRDKKLVCTSHKEKKICLVFSDKNGEPLNDNIFRRGIFYSLLAKADLPKIRIHDIRHTYASLLLQAGAPIHYVKEQLGHSSIATTVDLYGHCQPGTNREAVNRLD
jgi:integrase